MIRAAHQIIKRPLLTEKGTRLKEHGGAPVGTFGEEDLKPQVLFEVALEANKIQIREAVEAMFQVKVVDVSTLVQRGKMKRMGRGLAKRRNWKKAVVTLREGDDIQFFSESEE